MNPADRWVQHVRGVERSLVDDPPRARRVWLRAMILLGLALVCCMVRVWVAPGSGWDVLGGLVLGSLAALGALQGIVRSMAYRGGWLDGRQTMVAALEEAMQRGMPLDAWLQGEFERDMAVLGGVGHIHDDEDEEND